MEHIKNFKEFLSEENSFQEQQLLVKKFRQKFKETRLPQDFGQIFPEFINCVKTVQAQSQSDDYKEHYMSPFSSPDPRLIQKREDSLYVGDIIEEEVKKFLEKDENIKFYNRNQTAATNTNSTFIHLAIKFLKERMRIDIPKLRIKNIFNMIKKVTKFSNLKIEGNVIYAMNKDGDFRGPEPRGSVVRGTLGDTAAWYVEVHKDSISVGGDIELKLHLSIIYNKTCTALSGEVDEHDGEPFYQVFAQFEDGSEFLVDGENMGTSEEYVNGGKIKGSSTSQDKDVIDILIDFVENADEEDIKTLPDSK